MLTTKYNHLELKWQMEVSWTFRKVMRLVASLQEHSHGILSYFDHRQKYR